MFLVLCLWVHLCELSSLQALPRVAFLQPGVLQGLQG